MTSRITQDPGMKDDGGAAFGTFECMGELEKREGGLSIRDWFAGQALSGLLSNTNNSIEFKSDFPDFAKWAYGLADAILAERTKGE